METRMLHVFRNTPGGREALLQTAYFCKTAGISPVVYVPGHLKFLMYFENDVVQVDLDSPFLRSPETARAHVIEAFAEMGLNPPRFLMPKHFTGPTLPDIPVDYDFMTCPRSISDLSARIGPGYVGPRVRRILRSARFPMLIPAAAFKPFGSIAILFGGSANRVNAFRLGVRLGRLMNMPVELFTWEDRRRGKGDYAALIEKKGLGGEMERVNDWHLFPGGDMEGCLHRIPREALVVLGAPGHGLIRALFSKSTPERIQSILSNSLLMVGPNYRAAG